MLSAAILAVIVLGSIFADVIAPKDPAYLDLTNYMSAPSAASLFGTDSLGRDLYSCIWHGGRVSITIGLLSTLISTVAAVLYGTLNALVPKRIGTCMTRFLEILMSVPSLLLVLFLQAAAGNASVLSLSIVIGLTGWYGMALVVCTEVKQLRENEYVIAAKCMGGGFFYVLRTHYAPNFVASIMFMVVMNVRSAIVSESTLSFMGMGLPLEVISWGSILSLAENALMTKAWWLILIPGVFLIAFLLALTNIGQWIQVHNSH